MALARSAKVEHVSKQLYCDIITPYLVADKIACATICLSAVDACEGISTEKEQSSDRFKCNVCLVKAVNSPMKQFTQLSNDTRIYRLVIDIEKGKSWDLKKDI